MSEWRRELSTRLAPLHLPPARETEIIDELDQHLSDRVRDLVAGGADPDAARAAALADLDHPGALAQQLASIEARAPLSLPPPGAPARGRWFAARWQDVRLTLRGLRRAPGFAITAIVTLALTIGPTTAILSIGNWLFWRPMPGVSDPDRLGVVWVARWRDDGMSMSHLSYGNLEDLQRATRTLSGLAALQEMSASVAAGGLPPAVVAVGYVTANAFDVLGVRVPIGRGFSSEDDQMPYGRHVAVISDSFARRAFGEPRQALGQPVIVNGRSLSVIGVLDPAFRGTQPTSRADVWMTGAVYAHVNHLSKPMTRDDSPILLYVGRLAAGATFESAQTELDVLLPQLAARSPGLAEQFRGVTARLFPGLGPQALERPRYARLVRDLLMLAAVLLVLGCANVSNLLMVRGLRTRRDRAIRLALGATRARLVQLQLTESALVALGGGLAGFALAVWIKQLIVALSFPGIAAGESPIVPLDLRVLGMTVAVAIGCGLAAGLLPGLFAARSRPAGLLASSDSRTATGARRLRTGLAVVQLALSLALVTGALMLVTSLRQLYAVDLGLNPDGVSVHSMDPSNHGYSADRLPLYYDGILSRLQGTRGISAVSLSFRAPWGPGRTMRLQAAGAGPDDRVEAYGNAVTSGYFEVLRIPLLRGRLFSDDEISAGADVAVISARLSRRLFGDADAVGQTITLPGSARTPDRTLRVVGVAGDAQWRGIADDPELMLYQPFGDRAFGLFRATLLVRSPLPLRDVTARVQAAATELDPTLPVQFSRALVDEIAQSLSDQRLFAWMLSLLGSLGFTLAAVGLYGLLAQGVSERTREFGLRLALGSSRAGVFSLVLRQAAWIGAFGTAAGLTLAYFGSRLIEAQLFGVTRADPLTYTAAAGALAVVVLVAGLWPARTATRIDPVEALRAD